MITVKKRCPVAPWQKLTVIMVAGLDPLAPALSRRGGLAPELRIARIGLRVC